jgi:hypothetical protein
MIGRMRRPRRVNAGPAAATCNSYVRKGKRSERREGEGAGEENKVLTIGSIP